MAESINSAIAACLGEHAATYAANKHRGGSSGNKGTRYEDYFLAVKVAEAAVLLIENPDVDPPHLQGQVYGFVDDARVATTTSTGYYQLKNKDSVSWTSGDHPIVDDFELQYKLSKYLNESGPTTGLVVATEEQSIALRSSLPTSIQQHSTVHHFPWYETPNRLVLESKEIRSSLAKLANVDDPSLDVLTGVLGALIVGCMSKPDGGNVREILDSISKMYPGQLRSLPATQDWEQQLQGKFKNALARIDGLSYGAKRGFFYWSGFGTSGVFGSNVLSEAFVSFQDEIVQSQPRTFEDFEKLLP